MSRTTKVDPPTTRELLSCWPGGLAALAEFVGCAPSTITRLVQARTTHFPANLAMRCAASFRSHKINPFDEPMSMERLRMAWSRRKKTNRR